MMRRGLLNVASTFHAFQSVRTTVVVSRMFPTKLKAPNCTGPFYPKLGKQHYVYILEDFRNGRPAGDIELILTVDIDGLGFAGDVVKVKKKLARGHMLPTGVGIYVTPENLAKTEHMRKLNEGKFCQPESAHRTLKELEGMTVSIPINTALEWKLSKTHVRVGFRISGVELSEDCIEMPEEEIKTLGEHFVTVTVNKMDKVKVKLNMFHWDKTVTAVTPPIWSRDPKHKFSMEEVIAEATKNLKKRII